MSEDQLGYVNKGAQVVPGSNPARTTAGKRLFDFRRFQTFSLKNKIYFATIFVILFISMAIALLARWILVSSLTSELEQRGIAIAHSVAEQGRGAILEKDIPSLVSLVFDTALLGERKHLIAYVFIQDIEGSVLAHTFTHPFPENLRVANHIPVDEPHSILLMDVSNRRVYDIAVPVVEGIYRIASVHVGLNKSHIDQLINKLRTTFLGFISAIMILIFLISHSLSRYITKPISKLTKIADEISRGNFEVQPEPIKNQTLELQKCPTYLSTKLPCWHFDQSLESDNSGMAESIRNCKKCVFYQSGAGDELTHMAQSFTKMLWSIKLYRRKLRESEEKYRSLFYSGPDPVFVIDHKTHTILEANPRAEELYGYSMTEMIGRSFQTISPDYLHYLIKRFDTLEEDSQCVYTPKILHYKKGEKPFYVNAHACFISYKGKQAIILSCNDITEMIEKDAQLIQASKMKTLGEMSAGIAHELNQPLNAIKMGSEFLAMMTREERELQPEDLHQVATEISDQVNRASDIINTLRAFGRKADFVKERLDISKSIKGVLRIIGQRLKLDDIKVKLDLIEPLPTIYAHDNRIQQVLFNLLTNAIDTIEAKSEQVPGSDKTIHIKTHVVDGRVLVEIRDTGQGIPQKSLEKVFEPFFTTKETGQGMGLGLSITYGIVKDYNGTIRIDSVEGQGTTFILDFPVTDA